MHAIGSSRLSAGIAVLVLTLSSWLGAVHDATTMHVRCAEHGELMDGNAPPPGSRAVPPAGELRVQARSSGAAPGHEHCTISAATRASRIASSAPVLAIALLAAPAPTVSADATVRAPDRARYRTAPKTSPPG